VGAAWVFVRSRGVWTQQAKLVGTGVTGAFATQGTSVSLSDDGNTAIVGGAFDNDVVGAAWVFVRSRGVWTQQAKLVGTGAIGTPAQGDSVSLSADGNTAIVGGYLDRGGVGAAWVFTRSHGVWIQQGPKLVDPSAVGFPDQGYSVSISADGNIAMVGGPNDDTYGAAWVYKRSGGKWVQQTKLVGTGAVGGSGQGWAVSLSGDGSNAIVGGPYDNSQAGAGWVFSQQRVFAGAPGNANCLGQSVSALARQYGGLNAAAAALAYPSVRALQEAIMGFCEG
jgi:hypothetical protein